MAIQTALPQQQVLDQISDIVRSESVAQRRKQIDINLIDLSAPRPSRVLDYAAYKRARQRAIDAFPQHASFVRGTMTALAFSSLPHSPDSDTPTVTVDAVVELLTQSLEVSFQRLWLAIREDRSGSLSESALQVLLLSMSSEAPVVIRRVDEANRPFYEETIVAYALFFLDPKGTGRINTEDFLSSPVLTSILAVRDENFVDELQVALAQGTPLGGFACYNWFAPSVTESFYQQFLVLDDDHNGLLLPRELMNYDTGGGCGRISGGLTEYFVQRIYDTETQLYSGAMDWRGFIRVAIMLEHRSALASFRKLFDLLGDEQGHITRLLAFQYVQSVIDDLVTAGNQIDFGPRRLVLELWDSVQPANQDYLTVDDCLRSPEKASTALCVLYDSFMFYANDET